MRWLLCVLIFISSCHNSSTNAPNSLSVNIGSEPKTLDPRKARDLCDITLSRMLFEGLTRISRSGKTELALAESVDVSEDGLEYAFRLKNSAWSNGKPLTAGDFVESWRALLSPEFPSDVSYQLYDLQHARAIKLGEKSPQQLGAKALDDRTLVVTLERPVPYFLELCSMVSFLPVPTAISEANSEWYSEPSTFVGNGPFVLDLWTHNDLVQVRKNDLYWDSQSVNLEQIQFFMVSPDTELRMFEEKKLDWAGSPLSILPPESLAHLKESGELKFNPLSGTYFFRINTKPQILGKDNPLSSPLLRRALSSCIDREAITKHVLQGGQVPALRLVPPEMKLSSSSTAAGLIEGDKATGERIALIEPLVISFPNNERNMAVAQTVQKQWESALGIKVSLQPLESKVFSQSLKEGRLQIAIGSWIADFNDPINFLEVFKYEKSSTNNTGWEDPKFIDLLDRATVCKDQGERWQLMGKAEEILIEQMPLIPIFHFAINYLMREGVEDVTLTPIGQIDFRWTSIDDSRHVR